MYIYIYTKYVYIYIYTVAELIVFCQSNINRWFTTIDTKLKAFRIVIQKIKLENNKGFKPTTMPFMGQGLLCFSPLRIVSKL